MPRIALRLLALMAATVVVLTVVAARSAAPRRQYWGEASLSVSLPRPDAYCAARVQRVPERTPRNAVADRTVPPRGANLRLGPWRLQNPGMARNLAKVLELYGPGRDLLSGPFVSGAGTRTQRRRKP